MIFLFFICVLKIETDQINMVKKDDTLVLRNARVQMAKFRIYLKVDQWGVIEKRIPEQFNEKINTQNNVSETVWELAEPRRQPRQEQSRQRQGQGQEPPRQRQNNNYY